MRKEAAWIEVEEKPKTDIKRKPERRKETVAEPITCLVGSGGAAAPPPCYRKNKSERL